MKKIFAIITLIITLNIASEYEPSAYGAGNIDSSSPYGLTPTERNVLNNRREIQELKNRVEEQQNRIEGLITIIDGLNKEILSLKEQLKNTKKNIQELKEDNRTNKMILELSKIVDQINKNYITYDELQEALQQNPKSFNNTQIETQTTDIDSIYRKAIEAFQNRNYNLAKEYFQKAVAQNYKVASSNFYLGEIAFLTQNYPEAIEYYKKSASIYDKATYMKYLYLHTALSLKKVGDIDRANEFFQFIIDTYPNTKVAEIAKKNLAR